MQAENIVKGDAKTFRVQILTPVEPLRLDGYQSCQMDIYESPYNYDIPLISLHSSNPQQAIFYDRSKGIVQFYLLSSQTNSLEIKQYPYKMKITKDSEHIYTFHQGYLNITP